MTAKSATKSSMAKTPAKQTGGKGTGNRKGTSQSTAFARSRLDDTLTHPAPNETIPALSDHYGDMDVWLDIIVLGMYIFRRYGLGLS